MLPCSTEGWQYEHITGISNPDPKYAMVHLIIKDLSHTKIPKPLFICLLFPNILYVSPETDSLQREANKNPLPP